MFVGPTAPRWRDLGSAADMFVGPTAPRWRALLIANLPLSEPSYYYSERKLRTQERSDGELNDRRLKICGS